MNRFITSHLSPLTTDLRAGGSPAVKGNIFCHRLVLSPDREFHRITRLVGCDPLGKRLETVDRFFGDVRDNVMLLQAASIRSAAW